MIFSHGRFRCLLLSLLFSSFRAWAVPVEWAAPVDGDWSDPSKWNPAMIPGATSDVILSGSGGYTVTLDVDADILSLDIGEMAGSKTLISNNQTLTSAGQILVRENGRLDLRGTEIGGAGSLMILGTVLARGPTQIDTPVANEGLLRFRGSSNAINASFSNEPGAILRMLGDLNLINGGAGRAVLTVANGFTNSGSIELVFSGQNGGRIDLATGTLTNVGAIQTLSGDGNFLNCVFDNQGIIHLEGNLETDVVAADSINQGQINLEGGSWNFTQGDDSVPYRLRNFGTIDIGGGEGLSFERNGHFVLESTGEITTTTGTLSLTNSEFELKKDLMTGGLNTRMGRSRVTGNGTFFQQGDLRGDTNNLLLATTTNSGFMRFRGRGNEINGSFTNDAGGFLRVQGDLNPVNSGLGRGLLVFAQGFTSSGTVELRFSGQNGGSITVATGTLSNLGTIQTREGDGHFLNAEIDNRGVVHLEGDLETSREAAESLNEGLIDLEGGSWNFTQGDDSVPYRLRNFGVIEIGGEETLSFAKNGHLVLEATGDITTTTGTISLTNSEFELKKDYMTGGLNTRMNRSTLSGSGELIQQGSLLADSSNNLTAMTSNSGFMRFRGSGNEVNGSFTNDAEGFLRVQGDLNPINSGLGRGGLDFAQGFTSSGTVELRFSGQNGGSITVATGTLSNLGTIQTREGDGHFLNAEIDNRGVVHLEGDLETSREAAESLTEGLIDLEGGSWDFTQGDDSVPYRLRNFGVIEIGGEETLSFAKNGHLVLESTGEITTTTGTLSLRNSEFELKRDYMTGDLNTRLNRSTLSGSGQLIQQGDFRADNRCILDAAAANSGFLRFRGNDNEINGVFSNDPNGLLRVQGDLNPINSGLGGGDLVLAQGFTNEGTVELVFSGQNGAELNLATGTFTNNGSFLTRGGGSHTLEGPIQNAGLMTLDDPLAHSGLDETETNSGVIALATTTTLVLEDSVFHHTGSIQGGGDVEISSTVVFNGTGPIEADIENGGTLNIGGSPGILEIDGSYRQTGNGVLNIEIAGPAAGTEYDQMNITGAANISGDMNVTLLNGFIPSSSDSFTVMTYANRTGEFEEISGLTPGLGVVLLVQYLEASLRLDSEATLNPPTLIDLYERWIAGLTGSTELFRRSRTWLQE